MKLSWIIFAFGFGAAIMGLLGLWGIRDMSVDAQLHIAALSVPLVLGGALAMAVSGVDIDHE